MRTWEGGKGDAARVRMELGRGPAISQHLRTHDPTTRGPMGSCIGGCCVAHCQVHPDMLI
jgi:hypothetical protein